MKSRRPRLKHKPDVFPKTLLIILIIMAVLSGVGLDYMNWSRGKSSYIFSLFPKKEPSPREIKALGEIVNDQLRLLSISPVSQDQFWDSDDIHHLMIDLSLEDYVRIQDALERELYDIQASIIKKEEHQDEAKLYYLWQVKGKDGQRLSVLFSCERKDLSEAAKKMEFSKNMVAIIVDDMGYSMKAIQDVCDMNLPLTVAVIPHSPLAKQTAEIARRNSLEIILHLPLESVNGSSENEMKGIVLANMSSDEILSTLEDNLAQVPYIKGVNNHMGSKVTKNRRVMRLILQRLKKDNLYFVDSLTTGDSVAYSLAQRMGLPTAEREIFLDGELNEQYITRQLEDLFRSARKNGTSVGICHPNTLTIQTLKKILPRMQKYQCELVPASWVVR